MHHADLKQQPPGRPWPSSLSRLQEACSRSQAVNDIGRMAPSTPAALASNASCGTFRLEACLEPCHVTPVAVQETTIVERQPPHFRHVDLVSVKLCAGELPGLPSPGPSITFRDRRLDHCTFDRLLTLAEIGRRCAELRRQGRQVRRA